jgi:spermidine/putrescine ABC transporter ATP-binding subunit
MNRAMNEATSVLLSLAGIGKAYGAVRAVDGVSFDVARGAFFALLGPSGSGKTTLLRSIAGFEMPDTGTMLLDGVDLTGLKANRRPVNLMFQSYALFPHMTAHQNIAYGLEAEGRPRAEIERRVGDALELVKLGDLGARMPHQLSGGQRQRVALARALVKRPKLLLLDEPLGALDRKLRGDMQIELKALQRETGITFVVVTHDQEEALSMADTVCLLDKGRVVQIAAPGELYERPATRFAAEFIGRSNMLPGYRRGDRFVLDGLGDTAARNLTAVAEGAAAVLAIRPERLVLHADAADGRLAGRVAGVAYFGSEAEIHLALDATGQTLVARLGASALPGVPLAQGSHLGIDWNDSHARALA